MMKQKLLILALTCLLWNQNSSAELKVRFAETSAADKTSIKETLQKAASDFWFSEEQYWKVVPVDQELEIDFSLVSTDHLAQTRRHRINFNIYTPKTDLDSTLRHELAHVFLNTQCPQLTDAFAQELFAYWRSGDYLRMLYGQKQLFTKSDAFKELRDTTKLDPSKVIAIARLINELVKKGNEEKLKIWFSGVLRECQQSAFLKKQNQLAKEFLDQLQGFQSNASADENGFLVFDGLANEVIVAEGNWQKKLSVGSTLKPFAVSFFSDIKKTRARKNTADWECGDSGLTIWDYKKALNYSCNGFFIDVRPKRNEIKQYVETLNALTQSDFQTQWLNMADIIGLWPSLKLNILDLAKIYDYILEKDPTTINVLKQTAVAGTLSTAVESKWFASQGISLKSGTTTNLDLSVETGFVVAVFQTATTPKIAILFRSGRRPVDLLSEMKSKLEKYITYQDDLANVQVLSSFKLNSVKVACPTVLFKNGVAQPIGSAIDIHKIKTLSLRLSCAGEPFQVHAHDQVARRLYGDLTFQKIKTNANVSGARSEKNARARQGSELVLRTSEWHYLRSVFFSESGNYRHELKKAMLLVFKNNLEFWKTKRQPICDTTICQVFNLNYEAVTSAQKKTVDEMILDLGPKHLGSPQWLEFSVGGTNAWSKDISESELRSFLNVAKVDKLQIYKSSDVVKFVIGEDAQVSTCEKVRAYFKFRSCPESVLSVDGQTFQFSGRGEGHERGMDLTAANQMAIQGFNFDQIIEAFYKLKVQN